MSNSIENPPHPPPEYPQDWREKIIQLIETAKFKEGNRKVLVNGDLQFEICDGYTCLFRNGFDRVVLWSPEILGAAKSRREELFTATIRAKDDAQSEAIERILS